MSGLFKTPAPPPVQPPAPAPDLSLVDAQQRQKAASDAWSRFGRASTILTTRRSRKTGGDGSGNFDSYSSSNLGT